MWDALELDFQRDYVRAALDQYPAESLAHFYWIRQTPQAQKDDPQAILPSIGEIVLLSHPSRDFHSPFNARVIDVGSELHRPTSAFDRVRRTSYVILAPL
jgi:hypothetical protein